ncbi:MAG: DNA topoisomerase IV subunit A [Polyangiaceae bacterium]|nr:DNA topoisomerase IV subunit A [Polyangiaceae bacterium]
MDELETLLSDEAQRRYIAYALSVVTSRALPDVRDGLKPVQRRILYAMWLGNLRPDAKFKKCAKVVGDVLAQFHPHGDTAAYDAMVRLAQPWVMNHPLVDGQGNFGSPDGDGAAAYRYTEAKLLPMAVELLAELDRQTVGFRPTYDGSNEEPVVLPARLPHLLINGSQGIAVGMATSIPPHNLNEIIDACVAEIDAPEPLTTKQLQRYVKGPDFPTQGTLLATKDELHQIYETGQGTTKLRGDYRTEEKKGGAVDIIITSTPYAVERKTIVERIAEVIVSKKLPGLLDVRDESTAEVRLVLELKKGTDPDLVMAYLYKQTPLSTTVSVNLTALVPRPVEPGEARNDLLPCQPSRLSLGQMIRQFLDFRMEVVERRLRHDLEGLLARLHLLEGFAKAYDALDEILRIIRKSDGKADASEKLTARFSFTEEQADAILELRLYKLAKLEIQVIEEELGKKRAEAKRLEALLKSETKRWELIKTELSELKTRFGRRRQTKIGGVEEQEYSAEDFIQDEDATVILTREGWLKRVREVKDLSSTRVREGDQVLAVTAGSTRASVAFFSTHGACYVQRIHDVPATAGYGEPVQKLFKMSDGERIVSMVSLDPRLIAVPEPVEGAEPQPPYALAITKGGLGLRFSLSAHRDPSTRAGRKFARLNDGDEIVFAAPVGEKDAVLMASSDGHALGVAVAEIAVLGGAGKGSIAMKLHDDERVLGCVLAVARRDTITVETEKGRSIDLTWMGVDGHRADRGHAIVKRDRFARVVHAAPVVPSLEKN